LSLVYFTDRDLGNQFAEILRSQGLTVERHADHFVHDTPDEEWLEAVGKRGWIALTHNRRIRYIPNQQDAVIRHGVALLVVIGKAPLPELARAISLGLNSGIRRRLQKHPTVGRRLSMWIFL
jgi:hypothetical protein